MVEISYLSMVEISDLLETSYKPQFPELLAPYRIQITKEYENSDAWEANLCRTREDDGVFYYLVISAVYNEGQGGPNQYLPTLADLFARFNEISRKCFPTVLDPMDYACLYLELREAQEEQR